MAIGDITANIPGLTANLPGLSAPSAATSQGGNVSGDISTGGLKIPSIFWAGLAVLAACVLIKQLRK